MANKNSTKNKIILWNVKKIFQKFTTAQIACSFVKLKNSFTAYKDAKEDDPKDKVYFNEKAFYNAYKQHISEDLTKLNIEIKKLETSLQNDKKYISQINNDIYQKLKKQEQKYFKFELIWDDVIFGIKNFEDKKQKELLKRFKG